MLNKFKCETSGCGRPVTAHFVRAEKRVVAAERHLCADHAQAFLDDYKCSANTQDASASSEHENGTSFDPELLFFDEIGDPRGPLCQVFLIEAGGTRRFGITTGPYEGQALRLELMRYNALRPMTHRAMAAAIQSLGGQLCRVEIDRFFPAQEVAYEAKLMIQQSNVRVVVDVRPSDALVLAVICGVPIIVTNEVMAELAQAHAVF